MKFCEILLSFLAMFGCGFIAAAWMYSTAVNESEPELEDENSTQLIFIFRKDA